LRFLPPAAARLLAGTIAALSLAACGTDDVSPTAPATPAVVAVSSIVSGSSGAVTSKLNSAMCLDVTNKSNSNGAKVQVWTCSGNPNQQWTVSSAGELRVFGDKCLDAPSGNNGTQLQIWTCWGGSNQKWQVSSSGELKSASSGRCVDLWGAKAANGTMVALYDCNGGTNQQWDMKSGSSTPPPTTTPTDGASCSTYPYTRLVQVSSASQLQSAVQNARPGDRIQLADGNYFGWFNITASGTSSSPIVLCGSRNAVVGSGSLSSGNGIVLHANNWRLIGFTLSNSQTGIAIIGGSDNVLDNMEVRGTGQTAIHIRELSSRNRVVNSWIHHTGRAYAPFGEGVYVGTWEGQWCERTGCQPDRSDGNVITKNTFGPYVTAQNVDIKEGTTGTQVTFNAFSGVGMDPGNYNRSWVFNGGNGAQITDNKGSVSIAHGFENSQPWQGGGTTWGTGNVYRRNVADVQAWGYGFSLMGGTSGNNVVGCDNTVTNAGSGFANVRCTP
jgi:Ricin-type beta-trefoil lectin domain